MSPARTYADATSRWAGIGPYYAMFPVWFANEVVSTHSQPGDTVIDPFAGRGTAVFSAATLGRDAIGVEINPVGYVYAKSKTRAAGRNSVERRLEQLGERGSAFVEEAEKLPEFFHRCFAPEVQEFLLAARSDLDWRRNKTDCTVAAILLVYLHGKEGAALSNQMRQTKSMSPQYAVRWWDEHKLDPPKIDPVEFVKKRLKWRYAKGIPKAQRGRIYLGDSVQRLQRLDRDVERGSLARGDLLFTSPPYFGVTNYHYDQWLRLWLLGGPPNALRSGNGRGGKFEARGAYRTLLERVFSKSAKLLKKDAIIYVRTDTREFTYQTTLDVLSSTFPQKALAEVPRPIEKSNQTDLFGGEHLSEEKAGEIDLILTPK